MRKCRSCKRKKRGLSNGVCAACWHDSWLESELKSSRQSLVLFKIYKRYPGSQKYACWHFKRL